MYYRMYATNKNIGWTSVVAGQSMRQTTLLLDTSDVYAERSVIDPHLSLEMGKAGSCEFTLLPTHEQYSRMTRLTTYITVEELDDGIGHDVVLFRGRIVEIETDLYGQKKITCEGDLAYLGDSLFPPLENKSAPIDVTAYFTSVISSHNAQVETEKQFAIGSIGDFTGVKDIFNENSYQNTSRALESLIDYHGGYLRTRHVGETTYIDYVKDTATPSRAVTRITFASNLLDFTEKISAEDIFTVLVPLGDKVDSGEGETANSQPLTLTPDKEITVDSVIQGANATATFGRIVRAESFSGVKDTGTLRQRAEAYIRTNYNAVPEEFTVKAIDLRYLDDALVPFAVGENIRLEVPVRGVSKVLKCITIEYDFYNPDNTEISVGTPKQTLSQRNLTDQQAQTSSKGRGTSGRAKENSAETEYLTWKMLQDAKELKLRAQEINLLSDNMGGAITVTQNGTLNFVWDKNKGLNKTVNTVSSVANRADEKASKNTTDISQHAFALFGASTYGDWVKSNAEGGVLVNFEGRIAAIEGLFDKVTAGEVVTWNLGAHASNFDSMTANNLNARSALSVLGPNVSSSNPNGKGLFYVGGGTGTTNNTVGINSNGLYADGIQVGYTSGNSKSYYPVVTTQYYPIVLLDGNTLKIGAESAGEDGYTTTPQSVDLSSIVPSVDLTGYAQYDQNNALYATGGYKIPTGTGPNNETLAATFNKAYQIKMGTAVAAGQNYPHFLATTVTGFTGPLDLGHTHEFTAAEDTNNPGTIKIVLKNAISVPTEQNENAHSFNMAATNWFKGVVDGINSSLPTVTPTITYYRKQLENQSTVQIPYMRIPVELTNVAWTFPDNTSGHVNSYLDVPVGAASWEHVDTAGQITAIFKLNGVEIDQHQFEYDTTIGDEDAYNDGWGDARAISVAGLPKSTSTGSSIVIYGPSSTPGEADPQNRDSTTYSLYTDSDFATNHKVYIRTAVGNRWVYVAEKPLDVSTIEQNAKDTVGVDVKGWTGSGVFTVSLTGQSQNVTRQVTTMLSDPGIGNLAKPTSGTNKDHLTIDYDVGYSVLHDGQWQRANTTGLSGTFDLGAVTVEGAGDISSKTGSKTVTVKVGNLVVGSGKVTASYAAASDVTIDGNWANGRYTVSTTGKPTNSTDYTDLSVTGHWGVAENSETPTRYYGTVYATRNESETLLPTGATFQHDISLSTNFALNTYEGVMPSERDITINVYPTSNRKGDVITSFSRTLYLTQSSSWTYTLGQAAYTDNKVIKNINLQYVKSGATSKTTIARIIPDAYPVYKKGWADSYAQISVTNSAKTIGSSTSGLTTIDYDKYQEVLVQGYSVYETTEKSTIKTLKFRGPAKPTVTTISYGTGNVAYTKDENDTVFAQVPIHVATSVSGVTGTGTVNAPITAVFEDAAIAYSSTGVPSVTANVKVGNVVLVSKQFKGSAPQISTVALGTGGVSYQNVTVLNGQKQVQIKVPVSVTTNVGVTGSGTVTAPIEGVTWNNTVISNSNGRSYVKAIAYLGGFEIGSNEYSGIYPTADSNDEEVAAAARAAGWKKAIEEIEYDAPAEGVIPFGSSRTVSVQYKTTESDESLTTLFERTYLPPTPVLSSWSWTNSGYSHGESNTLSISVNGTDVSQSIGLYMNKGSWSNHKVWVYLRRESETGENRHARFQVDATDEYNSGANNVGINGSWDGMIYTATATNQTKSTPSSNSTQIYHDIAARSPISNKFDSKVYYKSGSIDVNLDSKQITLTPETSAAAALTDSTTKSAGSVKVHAKVGGTTYATSNLAVSVSGNGTLTGPGSKIVSVSVGGTVIARGKVSATYTTGDNDAAIWTDAIGTVRIDPTNAGGEIPFGESRTVKVYLKSGINDQQATEKFSITYSAPEAPTVPTADAEISIDYENGTTAYGTIAISAKDKTSAAVLDTENIYVHPALTMGDKIPTSSSSNDYYDSYLVSHVRQTTAADSSGNNIRDLARTSYVVSSTANGVANSTSSTIYALSRAYIGGSVGSGSVYSYKLTSIGAISASAEKITAGNSSDPTASFKIKAEAKSGNTTTGINTKNLTLSGPNITNDDEEHSATFKVLDGTTELARVKSNASVTVTPGTSASSVSFALGGTEVISTSVPTGSSTPSISVEWMNDAGNAFGGSGYTVPKNTTSTLSQIAVKYPYFLIKVNNSQAYYFQVSITGSSSGGSNPDPDPGTNPDPGTGGEDPGTPVVIKYNHTKTYTISDSGTGTTTYASTPSISGDIWNHMDSIVVSIDASASPTLMLNMTFALGSSSNGNFTKYQLGKINNRNTNIADATYAGDGDGGGWPSSYNQPLYIAGKSNSSVSYNWTATITVHYWTTSP